MSKIGFKIVCLTFSVLSLLLVFQVITSRCCYHSMSPVQSGLQLVGVSLDVYSGREGGIKNTET